jgi:hypothetical protein
MTYAIVIGTKADGTKVAVGDPLPLSQAKGAFQAAKADGLRMVELFELRQHSKRIKIAAAATDEAPKAPKTPKTPKAKTVKIEKPEPKE